MFFLLRCVFWLGLTFSAMDWPSDPLSSAAARDIAARAAAEATRLCLENPRDCARAARSADALARTGETTRKTARSVPAKPADTLNAADRSATRGERG